MYKTYLFVEGEVDQTAFQLQGEQAAARVRELVPGLVGYTQSQTLADQIRNPAPFIGIAELTFARAADALDTETYVTPLQSMLAPGARLGPMVTGRARTVMRLPAHHVAPHIKGVFPFRRKEGLSAAEFQHYWWHRHGPIAALTEGASFYLQIHPLMESYAPGSPPYDGITELHFRDMEDARTAMDSDQMTQDQRNDSHNFVDTDSVELFFAVEEVVIAA